MDSHSAQSLEPLRWASLQRVTPDLVLLDNMSDPLILHNLRKRFENGDIYVKLLSLIYFDNYISDIYII